MVNISVDEYLQCLALEHQRDMPPNGFGNPQENDRQVALVYPQLPVESFLNQNSYQTPAKTDAKPPPSSPQGGTFIKTRNQVKLLQEEKGYQLRQIKQNEFDLRREKARQRFEG